MDNTVTVSGNVTREPELKFVGEYAVAEFAVAVNKRVKNKQTGEWENEASFLDVTCWRELAENVAENVAKGTRVIVQGAFEQQRWEAKDGTKRSKILLVADDVGTSHKWGNKQSKKPNQVRHDEEPF